MRQILTIGVTLTLCIALAVGCAKKADLVATVGDQAISVDEFADAFRGTQQTFPSYEAELDSRREVLNTLIDSKLLLIGAYEEGLDTNREIRTLIEQQQGKFLLDQLYQVEIVSKVEVTDAEIRDWYDKSGEEIHARHVLVDTKEEADEVKALLDGGADFAEVARERSKDPSAATNGGDLSWFRWGTMVQPFQEAAFALAENEISQPVQSSFGYHVIQLLGRRPVDRQPFDQAEGTIRQRLTQTNTQARLREFLEALKEKAQLRFEERQMQLVKDTYRDTSGGPLPYVSNLDPALLNEKQRGLAVARYLDTMLTVGDFLKNLNSVAPMNRPSFDDSTALADVVFQMIFVVALEREARERRIDKTDEYLEKITQFQQRLMADKMRSDLMQRPVTVTVEEAQEYYDNNQEEFSTPPQARVREALVNTQEEAMDIIQQVRRGGDFAKICGERTLRPGMKAKKGDLGLFRRFQYPNLFDAAQRLNKGEVGGPVHHATQSGGQYSVIELISKQDAVTQKFDEVRERIINKLRNDRRQEAVDTWLADMKGATAIEVNEEVLAGTIDLTKYPEKG